LALNRRVEVLFGDEEYEALRKEAERRGISFGELIRDAARRAYVRPSEERRQRAIEFFTSGPQVDVGDWEEAKKLIGRWVDKEP
jgi:Ribbon-helix-helix protein, copG family